MASALHIQPPSREELSREIRQHIPAMYLFHDCPEWLRMEIFGRDFWMPPRLEDEPMVEHPVFRDAAGEPVMVKADGTLPCRTIYGIHRDARTNRPTHVGPLTGQDADAIIVFAVENYGERGVLWLRGDETDKKRKETSRKLYARWVRGWAESERAARSEFVSKFQTNPQNKGRVPPPPTPNQLRAQNLLDSQAISERASTFVCMVAYDWEGESWEKYARHMKAAHGQTVERPKDDTTANPGKARTVTAEEIESLSSAGGAADPAAGVIGAGMAMAAPGIIPGVGTKEVDIENPKDQRKGRGGKK
jgi:hypothetical protein